MKTCMLSVVPATPFLPGIVTVAKQCLMSFSNRLIQPTAWVLSITVLVTLFPVGALAQAPAAGDNWSHLSALPPDTKLHVSGDMNHKTCFLNSADDEKLVCSKGHNATGTHFTFTRAEVRSVRLTRYTVSTLGGMGIGLSAGLGVGAVIGETQNHGFLGGVAVTAYSAIGSGAGLIAGGAIGGTTDFLRGSRIYLRPATKH